LHEGDPAPISSEWVLIIKGIMWGLALVALVLSLRRLPEAVSKIVRLSMDYADYTDGGLPESDRLTHPLTRVVLTSLQR